jgi:glycosyltransferase involved in cell wall biosynthesis
MTTFNGERYLKAQIESLASQTVPPLELHIGDDGSTDNTEGIVRDFAVSAPFPVIFHRNHQKLGYGENFLQTALRCRGDWIAFCDQDDTWSPDKLSQICKVIASAPPSVLLIAHNARIVDDEGKALNTALLERLPDQVHAPFALPATWLCAGFRQIFRRSLLTGFDIAERIGTVDGHGNGDGCDSLPHDSWIPFLANMTGQICTLSADLVDYRRHGSNTTEISKGHEHSVDSLGNNAATYRRQARWHAKAGEALVRSADRPNDAAVRGGRHRLIKEARWLERRARMYGTSSTRRRVGLFLRQLSSGAYRESWGAGWGSLVKDALFAFGGPRLLSLLKQLA